MSDPRALGWVDSRNFTLELSGSQTLSLSMKLSPLIFLFPLVPCASSTVTRVLLAFRAHLCAKNEAREEEADSGTKLIPE